MSKLTAKIKEGAQHIFEKNPTIKTLFVNPKGEFFTRHNLAVNSVKSKDDVTEIPRASVVTDKEEPAEAATADGATRPNADETIKAIKAAKSLDELTAYEGDDRVTVNAAYEKKKKELEGSAN